jgi:hypothetical protein
MSDSYHKRPEWSYSSMKVILDSGIDYAVASKQGDLGEPQSKFIDLGQLVHMLVLGGDDTFAVSEFPDFRTKAAREWRDKQLAIGKNIITQAMFDDASRIISNIESHPYTNKFLLGTGITHEHEVFASTAENVKLRGKIDAVKLADDAAVITDIKTTAQFDKFFKTAQSRHYDLQAANYTHMTASSLGIEPSLVNFMFCVVETVAPYRVQFMHAGLDFVEAGERKLRTCIDEIVKFGDRKPNFLIEDIRELGDWSL